MKDSSLNRKGGDSHPERAPVRMLAKFRSETAGRSEATEHGEPSSPACSAQASAPGHVPFP